MELKKTLKDTAKKVILFSLLSTTLVLTCLAAFAGGRRSFMTEEMIEFLKCIEGLALNTEHIYINDVIWGAQRPSTWGCITACALKFGNNGILSRVSVRHFLPLKMMMSQLNLQHLC